MRARNDLKKSGVSRPRKPAGGVAQHVFFLQPRGNGTAAVAAFVFIGRCGNAASVRAAGKG